MVTSDPILCAFSRGQGYCVCVCKVACLLIPAYIRPYVDWISHSGGRRVECRSARNSIYREQIHLFLTTEKLEHFFKLHAAVLNESSI